MSWLGLVLAVIGGIAVGFLLAPPAIRRRGRLLHPEPEPDDRASLALIALNGSSVAHVVLDYAGHVRFANARSREFGLVRAGMIDGRIRSMLGVAVESGGPVDVELGSVAPVEAGLGARRPPLAVQAVIRVLGPDLVLVQAADETEAMRLDTMRRDFVANVSHELKTPVAAISLLAEAVRDAGDDQAMAGRFADRLVRESNRLGAMVTELITLSRLQGADPLPELSAVAVDSVIAEAAGRAATLAEGAGITMVLAPPTGRLVLGDRPMLLTALTNLIDNAIHYSPSGTTVSISSGVRDGHVEIAVTDRGIGIAPELQDRVFERFFRVDPARSRATGGTGLGLAIVKHVAANHGGSAVVWSKPGTGSTFTVRLPEHVPAADRTQAPPQSAPQSDAAAVGKGIG